MKKGLFQPLLLFLVWITIGVFQGKAAWAQGKVEEAENKVHSILIYNFTKYVNWPEEYNTGDFVIGILGETELTDELQKMAREKNVSNRKIVIRRYTDPTQLEGKFHILFVSTSSSNQLSAVLKKTKGQPTLVITHKDGLGRAGSLINFVSANGKFRFEINLGALEKNGLKCAQQLKNLAIVI